MRIARELIDADAAKVVRRLARHGHQAYLVGGCVRDLLLDRTPKDFDVATSATPKEIKNLFRNSRIIGRRFRLAHVFFGGKIIETSTFRANPRQEDDPDEDDELLIRRDNVFGTDTEDARRRDFTINGLFYDVEAEHVIDHVGGLADLESRVVRTIGNPEIRFREDPVRMLRAIKFAARLNFQIEPETYSAILRHRGEISKSAQPRVLEELYRLLRGGAARRSLELLVETGIAALLSPQLAAMLSDDEAPWPGEVDERTSWTATWEDEPPSPEPRRTAPAPLALSFIDSGDELLRRRTLAWRLLGELDTVASNGGASNALALSALCAPFVIDNLLTNGVQPIEANEIIAELMHPLVEQLRIARRDAERTRQVLLAQRRLAPARRRRGKPMAMVRRDYFEEALTMYEMLGAAEERDVSDAEYWRKLQKQGSVAPTGGESRPARRRRRRRGGRRRRRNAVEHGDSEREPAIGG
jgi:poly(A) polymerase